MAINKNEFYKIYTGQQGQDNPKDWTIYSAVHRKHLKRTVRELVSNVKNGVEVYILTPSGEVKAYFRDSLDKIFA